MAARRGGASTTGGSACRPASTATSVRVEIVEDPFPEGPYGAKGISEIATVPSTPAILNAIHDATGVRAWEIPMTPTVLRERMAASAEAAS